MTTRKEIRSLLPDELLALRSAMLKYQDTSGSGGYVELAGYHWIPKRFCQHGYPLFLPWHRIYLSTYEKALQAIDSTVSLPYWNWTSPDSLQHGIPAAFTDDTFTDTDGRVKRNPLKSGPINDGTRLTVRFPSPLYTLAQASQSVDIAQRAQDFQSYNILIQPPHINIHSYIGGIGGDMSTFDLAAFDPLFWSHHAMIDFLWAKWQLSNPNPTTGLTTTLKGFEPISVGDVLDTTNALLNYTYEGLSKDVVNIRLIPRRVLRINDVLMGEKSFIVEVFFRWMGMEQRVHAGTFGIVGMTMQMGHGHDLPSMAHKPMRFQQYIDVTDVLNKYSPPPGDIKVGLEGMNMKGKPVPQKDLPIGKIEFIDM